MAIMNNVEQQAASLAGTNKSKQQARRARMYSRNPQYRNQKR